MTFLSWENKYSVGIKEIDSQHQMLFNYINELHDAMKAGKSKEILDETLKKLADYAHTHFTAEEGYMSKYKYPELPEHKVEHMKFFEKVNDFQMKFNKSNFMTSLELMDFLKQWLMHHIMETDKKYAPFLISKGAK